MKWVILTALAVGSATVLGAILGLLFKRVNETLRRCLIAAAAGVMLHSAMFGLIAPAMELSHKWRLPLLLFGLLCGFLFLSAIRAISPRLFGSDGQKKQTSSLLFILAMGIHHIPEGIAAGVSFGTGNAADVITVSGGIALQNIPEAMVLIAPMLALGLSELRAAGISLGIALLEALGVLVGFFAISFSMSILPFSLGFAAGTMIYVMLTDMVPDACPADYSQKPIYSALLGFSIMTALSIFL